MNKLIRYRNLLYSFYVYCDSKNGLVKLVSIDIQEGELSTST